jgi:hypothetical protein
MAACAVRFFIVQSVLRGCLWRQRVKREANQELVFVGMKPQVRVVRQAAGLYGYPPPLKQSGCTIFHTAHCLGG